MAAFHRISGTWCPSAHPHSLSEALVFKAARQFLKSNAFLVHEKFGNWWLRLSTDTEFMCVRPVER